MVIFNFWYCVYFDEYVNQLTNAPKILTCKGKMAGQKWDVCHDDGFTSFYSFKRKTEWKKKKQVIRRECELESMSCDLFCSYFKLVFLYISYSLF